MKTVLFAVTLWLAASCQADKLDDVKAELDEMKTTVNAMQAVQKDMQSVLSLLARESLENAVDERGTVKFVRSSTCASDAAAISLPLGDIQGIPGGVSGPARCSLYCQDLNGCLAFNFRSKPTSDGTQCQLHTKAPVTFAAASDCQFYKTTGRPTAAPAVISNIPLAEVLVQQHYGGTTFFDRTWEEFKAGFGDVNGNYWIGNDRLHELTKDGVYKLRVELQMLSDSQWYFADYNGFIVGDEASGYKLNIGGYSGRKWDSLVYVNGMKFTTKYRDNDAHGSINCATDAAQGNGGGFWYRDCGYTFLNSPAGTSWGGFTWNNPTGGPITRLLASRMWLMRR